MFRFSLLVVVGLRPSQSSSDAAGIPISRCLSRTMAIASRTILTPSSAHSVFVDGTASQGHESHIFHSAPDSCRKYPLHCQIRLLYVPSRRRHGHAVAMHSQTCHCCAYTLQTGTVIKITGRPRPHKTTRRGLGLLNFNSMSSFTPRVESILTTTPSSY
jgi:hypothetical protein